MAILVVWAPCVDSVLVAGSSLSVASSAPQQMQCACWFGCVVARRCVRAAARAERILVRPGPVPEQIRTEASLVRYRPWFGVPAVHIVSANLGRGVGRDSRGNSLNQFRGSVRIGPYLDTLVHQTRFSVVRVLLGGALGLERFYYRPGDRSGAGGIYCLGRWWRWRWRLRFLLL